MLVLKPFTEDHGRSMVQAQAIPPVSFLALHGFPTHQLAYMLDSLVRVSRRAVSGASASILRTQLRGQSALKPRSARWHGRGSNPHFCPTRLIHADQLLALRGGPVRVHIQPRSTHASDTLPPQQFQALFNSLFKGLFIFPSRYLFAIGLLPVFSLRRDVPPN